MTYALVIAGFARDKPNTSNDAAAWSNFLPDATHIVGTAPKVERLAQAVWLIPLDSDLHILGELVTRAKGWQVPLRVLFLDEAPSFATLTL